MLQGSQDPTPRHVMCLWGWWPQANHAEGATHRKGTHIGPIGGWVTVFLRQTYSSSMTPANNYPPSMYVWKGGNSFLGGRGGHYE